MLDELIKKHVNKTVPEYQSVRANWHDATARDEQARRNLDAECKPIEAAVRKMVEDQIGERGRVAVNAYPLVDHSVRPMTATPHIRIQVHAIEWEAPRRDFKVEVEMCPKNAADVEDAVGRLVAMLRAGGLVP